MIEYIDKIKNQLFANAAFKKLIQFNFIINF